MTYKDQEIVGIREMLASFAPAPGAAPPTREESRAATDAWGLSIPVPDGCSVEELTADGVPCERLIPRGSDATRSILYLHGGGYTGGSSRSHRQYVARLAEASGTTALNVDYRLAPEHPFPAAVEDAVSSYRWLLDQGLPARQIAIAGDSAGGGLTVAAALAIRKAGLPPPGCLYPISPWADLTQAGASYDQVGDRDPMCSRASLNEASATYLNGADARDPLASPVLGDLQGFPPMLIHVGSEEVLLSDSLLLAERAALAGVEVRLDVWPEMIHVWPVFHAYLAAGRRAIDEASAWIKDHLR